MEHINEIQIPNGRISFQASSEAVKKTRCAYCQKDIYIVYTKFGAKLPANLINGSYVLHDIHCPHSDLYKREKANREMQKRYEERIAKKKHHGR